MHKFQIGRLLSAVVTVAALAFACAVHGQDYPNKVVRVVVPYPAGSLTDTLARLLAEKLQTKFGQPVIVENRAGASGNVGAEAVAKAAPDGYTLMFSPPGTFVTNKLLYAKLAYDPDVFTPISVVAIAPVVLLVNPNVAAQNVQQLIAYAKANPDRLNYASSGVGGLPHLGAELFNSMAGIRIVHVPYQGTAPALTALLSGQVEILFDAVGAALPGIRAGKLRVLAVGSEKRTPILPDIPAMSETLPGFVSMVWVAMAAPPKTPVSVVSQLSTSIAEAAKQSDLTKRMLDLSFEAIGGTPAEMAQLIREETERWGKVVRLTGAKAD